MKHSAFEKIAQFWRDRTTLLIVLIAGLGTANILVRTATYGAEVTTGSVAYLSTALNFLAGEGWRDFVDRPMATWPPLFPLLLVAFGWVGIEPLEAGRWINATAFGLTILAAGCWLRSNLQSRWLTLTATAIIAASRPLSDLASRFMTEPLFVLFTLLALMQLAAFLNRRTDAPLWWAAVFYRASRNNPLCGRGADRRRRPRAAGASRSAAGRPVKARHREIWGRLIHPPRRGADAQLGGLRDPDRAE